MADFITQFNRQLSEFSDYATLNIQLNSPVFRLQAGCVAQFLAEIRQTAHLLSTQQQAEYSAYYAEQLVQQFDTLKRAIAQKMQTSAGPSQFRSSYQFAPNIHQLPNNLRLIEYKKALRALNEKLAWLSEQSYLALPEERQHYVLQIAETERRKQRCLEQIELLDGQIIKGGFA